MSIFSHKNYASAMKLACEEARQWLGNTSPNPAVGAIALDETGNVLAVTAHQHAGESHAEVALLEKCRQLGLLDRVSSLGVTLEPCNHYGRTPPCTEALISSGVSNIFIGVRDPNPHVKGGGIQRLRQAGLHIEEDINTDECSQLISSFSYYMKHGRPWITLKRAFDSHGSMIPPKGQKTFTSPSSLRLAHRLRKKADAIITGSGTVVNDAPYFTVRHTNDFPQKPRLLAIFDRRGRVSNSYLKEAEERDLNAVKYSDFATLFHDCKTREIQDVLVEAGPLLSTYILEQGYWNMLVDIHQGETDRVEIKFNESLEIPFQLENFNLEYILPP